MPGSRRRPEPHLCILSGPTCPPGFITWRSLSPSRLFRDFDAAYREQVSSHGFAMVVLCHAAFGGHGAVLAPLKRCPEKRSQSDARGISVPA